MINMSNNDYFAIDKKLSKRSEPNTELVIKPYSSKY